MEVLLENALLFDFYGELLTGHQREIYEDFALNDLSLGEIAQNYGISRQGVYDIVRRCKKQLIGYEEKLHLVRRFMKAREELKIVSDCARELIDSDDISFMKARAEKILAMTTAIAEEL